MRAAKGLILLTMLNASPLALAIPESTVSHRPGDFIQAIQNDPNAGKQIYAEFCASCHAVQPAIQVGAPRFQNTKDWQAYSSLSLEELLNIVDAGRSRMPPRGGCFECSDEHLKAAILYMLPPENQISQ